MRLDVLTPTGSMTTPGTFERPWIYMLHLNVSHQNSFARERAIITTAFPFASESTRRITNEYR